MPGDPIGSEVDALAWPLVGRAAQRSMLLRAVTHGRGALVVGEAGIGKTRLATAVLDLLASRGWHIVRIHASDCIREIPLGALWPLLPAVRALEPSATTISAAVSGLSALAADARADRLVVFVDDIDSLDGMSAVVTSHLVTIRGIPVLATTRTGRMLPEPVRQLVVSAVLERLDLTPLPEAEMLELFHTVLRGSIAPEAAARLIRLCGGVPLFAREILLDGLQAAYLHKVGAEWQFDRPNPASSPRLSDLLVDRLRGASAEEREALEIAAMAVPIGLRELSELVTADALAALERRGLLTVDRLDRRLPVRLSHPLYRELVADSTPAASRLGYARQLADQMERHDLRRADDLLRWALWRLDGGGPIDTARLTAAAGLAVARRVDLAVRERLTRAAYAADPSVANGLLLYQSLVEVASDDLDSLLADLAARARTEPDRAAIMIAHAYHIGWVAHRPDEGTDALDEVARTIHSPALLSDIMAHRAMLYAMSGRPGPALADAREALVPSAQPGARMIAGTAAALANLMTASFPQARAATDLVRTLSAQADRGSISPVPAAFLLEVRILADQGYAQEALRRAAAAVADAIANGDPMRHAWSTAAVAYAHLCQGDLDDAATRAADAGRLFASLAHHSGQRWTLALRLLATVQRGQIDEAGTLVKALRAMPDLGQIRCYDIDETVGMAWYEFLTTDAAAARDRLERAAHGWLAEQSTGLAMLATFALFRLRFGDCAAALLDRIEVPADWPFGNAVSALIRARRPADYVTAGDAFRAQDMRLLAAEAYYLAATRTRPHGPPQRTRALQAAAALAQQCRADTPLLGRLSPATALTRREEQIAALAAGGASNREVAQHLGLSERTVENHLHRAFAKLGVTRRSALSQHVPAKHVPAKD
ncbi:LuxR family transcriptional regulator [Phytohabitans houttuyneae]